MVLRLPESLLSKRSSIILLLASVAECTVLQRYLDSSCNNLDFGEGVQQAWITTAGASSYCYNVNAGFACPFRCNLRLQCAYGSGSGMIIQLFPDADTLCQTKPTSSMDLAKYLTWQQGAAFLQGKCTLGDDGNYMKFNSPVGAFPNCSDYGNVAAGQAGAANCTENPDVVDCCTLEPQQPCLFKGFIRNDSPCSPACQMKYQTLGYNCYSAFKDNFQWMIMALNCDPQKVVKFAPTSTTPASQNTARGSSNQPQFAPASTTPASQNTARGSSNQPQFAPTSTTPASQNTARGSINQPQGVSTSTTANNTLIIVAVSIVFGVCATATTLIACCLYRRVKVQPVSYVPPSPQVIPAHDASIIQAAENAKHAPTVPVTIGFAEITRISSVDELTALSALLVTRSDWLGKGRDVATSHERWSGLKLIAAWRVSNEFQDKKFQVSRDMIKMTSSKHNFPSVTVRTTGLVSVLPVQLERSVNEVVLLHGTSPANLMTVLSSGLDERFSTGLFGDGSYLAEDAGKCDQYCIPETEPGQDSAYDTLSPGDPNKPKAVCYMLVCRAVLGYAAATKDGTTQSNGDALWAGKGQRELVPFPGSSPPEPYHSLIAELGDKIVRYREFVVFHKDRLKIDYLIAYERVSEQMVDI